MLQQGAAPGGPHRTLARLLAQRVARRPRQPRGPEHVRQRQARDPGQLQPGGQHAHAHAELGVRGPGGRHHGHAGGRGEGARDEPAHGQPRPRVPLHQRPGLPRHHRQGRGLLRWVAVAQPVPT